MNWRRGKRKRVDLLPSINPRHQAPAEASVGVSVSNKTAADGTHYFRPPPPSHTRTAAFPEPRTAAGCRRLRQAATAAQARPSSPPLPRVMATPLRAHMAPNAAKLDRCRQQHNGSRELSSTEGRAGGRQHHANNQRTKAATPHHARHPTYRRRPPPSLVHPDKRVARQLIRLDNALEDGFRRQKTEPAAGSDHR